MAGVYYPAVLGALTIIPVYFIGKEIFNRWVGVISAGLIAVLPGEFLGRSILGFTDLVILIYLIIKQGSAEKSLLVVWSLVILLVTLLTQRRFAAYLAVNVALLSGYPSALIFFATRHVIAYLRGEPNNYPSLPIVASPNLEKLLTIPRDATLQRIEKAKAKRRKPSRLRTTRI